MSKKPEVAMAEISQIARAKAAERMRRSRLRHTEGMHCYTLELRDVEIGALVDRGLLAPDERTDRKAVVNALYAFLDRTLGRPM